MNNCSDFNYEIKDWKLTFGDVIALAGDFYSRWQLDGCIPSISDDWDSDPEKSLGIAAENVNLLRTDSPGILKCVQSLIQEQGEYVKQAAADGRDIAQDAKKAYSSVHTLALRKAQEAYKSKKESDLTEAYFIEGFAQHFLTDMFAAGHIRTLRRLLHSTTFTLDLYPGDQCGKGQQDEDGTNGPWVTNQEGESWAAYGDKQLGQCRSGKNRQMVAAASQAGVDEVWETFQSGKIPATAEFKALKKVCLVSSSILAIDYRPSLMETFISRPPLPEKTLGITNSVPLFERDPEDASRMLFRQNIDNRAIAKSREVIDDIPTNDEWAKYLKAITNSGSSKNMYVYSRSFASDQRFLHLGQIERGGSDLVSNLYGPVDAGKFGQNWNMAAQGVGSLKASEKKRPWTNAQSLADGVVSLVAREHTGGGKTNALHVGYSFLETSNGQLRPQVLWSQAVDDGNSDRSSGEVIYGSFSQYSSKRIMVKYFEGSKADSKLEFWSLLNSPPSQLSLTLNTTNLNFLLSHKIEQTDSFSTIVGYQSGPLSTSAGTWHFCSWTSEYQKMRLTTISETNSSPAQALVSDPLSNRLVRVYYDKRHPTVKTLQIDVLLPTRDVFPSRANGTFDAPVVSEIQLDPKMGTLFTAEFMEPLYTAQTTFTYANTGHRTSAAIMSFFDNYGIIATRIIAPEASRGTYKYALMGQDSAIAGQRSTTLGERRKDLMGLRRKTQRIGIMPV
ncbi:unnamed protein product [Clonostachys rhizophaga]|uniref:Uncharacterized protein n=1 Tax=Clonostachys rhizophaga TaxID=160324 RepID=A0A9N9V303_9HYPO|nr:unnamed protein product [Clonostachys rhizophaga]